MNKDNFIDRWSKRKLQPVPEAEEAVEVASGDADEPAALDGSQPELLPESEADLIAHEMGDENAPEGEGEDLEPHPAEGIDIETLEYESDFTVFMQDKVPEKLRRMALRKLWRSNPILANIDGLNDYDEDFTDAATVFINSAGDVISGVRDQFWDDKQIAEGKDRIGEDENTEELAEETADDGDAEETEVAEADVSQGENFEEIDDAEVEDIEDFEDFEFINKERNAPIEQDANQIETLKVTHNGDSDDEVEKQTGTEKAEDSKDKTKT